MVQSFPCIIWLFPSLVSLVCMPFPPCHLLSYYIVLCIVPLLTNSWFCISFACPILLVMLQSHIVRSRLLSSQFNVFKWKLRICWDRVRYDCDNKSPMSPQETLPQHVIYVICSSPLWGARENSYSSNNFQIWPTGARPRHVGFSLGLTASVSRSADWDIASILTNKRTLFQWLLNWSMKFFHIAKLTKELSTKTLSMDWLWIFGLRVEQRNIQNTD